MYDPNLGERIQNVVEDAINSKNFSKLNQDIREAVNTSLMQIGTNQNRFYQEYEDSETTIEDLERVEGEIVNGDIKADLDARRRAEQEARERARAENQRAREARQRAQNRNQNRESREEQYRQYWKNQTNRWQQQWQGRQTGQQRTANNQGTYTDQERQARRADNVRNRYKSTDIVPITKNPPGKVSGTLLTVFGTLGLIGSVGMMLAFGLANGLGGMPGVVFDSLMSCLAAPALVVSTVMTVAGKKKKGRIKRFYQYVRQLRGRAYCSIKELSSHIGRTDRFVLKDLRKMISLGMFPEGHIDDQETCVMLNGATYEQYRKAQTSYQSRILEEKERKRNPERFNAQESVAEERKTAEADAANTKETESTKKNLPPEVVKILTEGEKYLTQIREANDAIPGETISAKLDQLEEVIRKIYTRIEEHPEQVGELEKFIRYYLPTTLKLVNAYKEFDAQPSQGENILNSKKEIEATLDTILYAFETLLDSLYEDDALDISTDISVLQTMFAQEGLTKSAFKQENKE